MDEAERCHRVGLLHHGQLLTEGRPTALLAELARDRGGHPSFDDLFFALTSTEARR